MKGLLLDKDGDIRIVPHKGKDGLTGFVIGDTLIQNAAIVLELNQGELKEDPVLGANLIRCRQNHSRTDWDAHFSRVRGSICFPVWGELP